MKHPAPGLDGGTRPLSSEGGVSDPSVALGFSSAMETAMEYCYVLIVGVANGTAATPQWTRPGPIAVPAWGRCSRAE